VQGLCPPEVVAALLDLLAIDMAYNTHDEVACGYCGMAYWITGHTQGCQLGCAIDAIRSVQHE
jgi:hypothetical protein